MKGQFRMGGVAAAIEIFDTPAGRALAEVLPLEVAFQATEEEIQFSLPLHPLADVPANEIVPPRAGDIVYLPGQDLLVVTLRSGSPLAAPTPGRPAGLAARILGSPAPLGEALGCATLRIEPMPEERALPDGGTDGRGC